MKFYCIADEDTVRGFRLAGVEGRVVADARQAAEALAEAAAHADCGIVILTERVAVGIRERVDAIRFERARPLIVEVPGSEGPLPDRRSLRQLVQAAVGIRLGAEEGGS
ncbi:MAG: Vacuolar H+transporting two-sector ATPase F subunit [Verrucomicrobia bacterium]|nr:Vacuolar H+transporting two-sector ATPase F subunit [Verrucomicrobiota bacterium]